MAQDNISDAELEGLVQTLGIESLCQWDVLVFLYHHHTCLLSGDYLAGLLGYETEPVITALDALEARGLVARSRVSQGARLYQFTAPPRGDAFERLLSSVGQRAGRIRLSQQLRRGNRSPQQGLEAAQPLPKQVPPGVRVPRQRAKRSPPWRQAI